MKEENCEILENVLLSENTYRMTLRQQEENFPRPGMFFALSLPSFFLRRPFSLMDHHDSFFTFVYKVVGKGTKAMSEMRAGTSLNALLGLGNGYDLSKSGDHPLLIGGGSGIGVMVDLARFLLKEGKHPLVAVGFNRKVEIYAEEELRKMSLSYRLFTVDGSAGEKGFPTLALSSPHDYIYACGPFPLLKAIALTDPVPGQFSLERRMGCGYGCCMGCTIETKRGPRRVCKDGPVFEKEDLLW